MISVCMATHNGGKYIKEQLESILSQLEPSDEVVVSDDGSTDGTLDEIICLNDKRVHVYKFVQPRKAKHPHEYVCRNFENAIKHAKGDYIFLSDQDDIWLPNKVEVCIKGLKSHDLVLHDFMHIDSSGDIIKERHYDGIYAFRHNNFLMKNGKHFGCAMAFRKKVLDYSLPFPKHLLIHDYWIGILTELLGDFYFESTPLIKYRIHQQNTSGSRSPLFHVISYRIETIHYIIKRVLKYKIVKLFFKCKNVSIHKI